jgi:Tol biopolymer transport system component
MRAGDKATCLASLALAACLVAPSGAGATFPGHNGRIAFKRFSDRSQTTSAIFSMTARGQGERQLTHPPKGIRDDQPDWSPDGTRLTFERCGSDLCEVWTVAADGTGETRIGPDCLTGGSPAGCESRVHPAFSPQGLIAFGRGYGDIRRGAPQHADLDVVDPAGGALRTVLAAAPFSVRDASFAWSPDGRRIAAELDNSSSGRPRDGIAVSVVGADGQGSPRRLTPYELRGGDGPDWSPDGRRILLRSHADRVGPGGSQLYTVRPDGTGLRALTHFAKRRTVLSSSFSPDGRWITVALDGRAGLPDIYIMHADGTHLRQLTRTSAWDSAPDWGPSP